MPDEFIGFPKIERLENLYCVISEKIDGTNAQIQVRWTKDSTQDIYETKFGSKNRFIDHYNDNHGFANFYKDYTDNFSRMFAEFRNEYSELRSCEDNVIQNIMNRINPTINIFRIYGEWFGSGIQRGYGLKDKYFMPFDDGQTALLKYFNVLNVLEKVTLYKGRFSEAIVEEQMNYLRDYGSRMIPGYDKPEGIVIYFPHYDMLLKQTFTGPKWKDNK